MYKILALRNAFFFLIITLIAGCDSQSSNTSSANIINPRSGNIEDFVVQCQADCTTIVTAIKDMGGNITIQYQNVNAVAVSVPVEIVKNIQALVNIKGLAKDRIVHAPSPATKVSFPATDISLTTKINGPELNQFLAKLPANFNYNNLLTGATTLHLNDQTGKDVVVAIIDTGTANNADIVPALAGSVLGGENFVMLADEPSATSTLNDSHGTWVGSMIASHVGLIFPTDHDLVQSLLAHTPESVVPNDATTSLIPVIGTAPEARLYALKVFPANGDGAPASRIIEAMDRAITLKRNFNDTGQDVITSGDGSEDLPFVYEALNIQVVNMSLGGPTLFPGLNVEDMLTRKMLMSGITLVTSAGNEGAAALTTSSPSTGVGALSVGAANTPVHERVLGDLQFGPGVGIMLRPNNTIQVAQFSSRGPVADGRVGVDLVANGYASFVQGASGDVSLVSGTSFSSPTVAGAAALLWGEKPDANAEDVRKALMVSADPGILQDMSMTIDQGNGFLNVPAALDALMANPDADIPDLPELGKKPTMVKDNINKQNLEAIKFDDGEFSMMLDLKPGQVKHVFVPSKDNTKELEVSLIDIMPELPLDEQNQLFGDDILLTIIDAPTTFNAVIVESFVNIDETFTLPLPQQGLVRIAVMGDWTNAGNISAKLVIKEKQRQLSRPVARGRLEDQDIDVFEVEVDDNTKQITLELFWNNNWGSFPAHDIDLYLVDPNDNIIFDGATLNSPERIVIDDPMPGDWIAVIEGFSLHGFKDEYLLRATDDQGNRLEVDD